LLSLLSDHTSIQPVGPNFSDSLAGLFAAFGIVSALLRNPTGMGQHIETNLGRAWRSWWRRPQKRWLAPALRSYLEEGIESRLSALRQPEASLKTVTAFFLGMAQTLRADPAQAARLPDGERGRRARRKGSAYCARGYQPRRVPFRVFDCIAPGGRPRRDLKKPRARAGKTPGVVDHGFVRHRPY
jgi:hypothetical protein